MPVVAGWAAPASLLPLIPSITEIFPWYSGFEGTIWPVKLIKQDLSEEALLPTSCLVCLGMSGAGQAPHFSTYRARIWEGRFLPGHAWRERPLGMAKNHGMTKSSMAGDDSFRVRH